MNKLKLFLICFIGWLVSTNVIIDILLCPIFIIGLFHITSLLFIGKTLIWLILLINLFILIPLSIHFGMFCLKQEKK
jgi:hypothetical protein